MKALLIFVLIIQTATAADFSVEKTYKGSYNIYDWNTGNTYYGKYNGKRMMKIYPKTVVDSENVLYPRSYEIKGYSESGPYDGDPYD